MSKKCIIYVDGVEIANKVDVCFTRESRRKGLLGRDSLGEAEGVIMNVPGIQKKLWGYWNSIHMVGMKFPIAVTWIDGDNRIVHSCNANQQGLLGMFFPRLYSSRKPASYIIELHPSHLPKLNIGSVMTVEHL